MQYDWTKDKRLRIQYLKLSLTDMETTTSGGLSVVWGAKHFVPCSNDRRTTPDIRRATNDTLAYRIILWKRIYEGKDMIVSL